MSESDKGTIKADDKRLTVEKKEKKAASSKKKKGKADEVEEEVQEGGDKADEKEKPGSKRSLIHSRPRVWRAREGPECCRHCSVAQLLILGLALLFTRVV